MELKLRRAVKVSIALAMIVMFCGVVLFWMPYQRELSIAGRIRASAKDAKIEFGCYGPAWIAPWVQRNLLIFNRIRSIHLPQNAKFSVLVSDIKALSRIELLSFSGSDITDGELADLKVLKTLRVLDFRNTAITDAGLEQLHEMTNLERLYLGETAITDEGLRWVGDLTRLDLLDLNQTQISDEGLQHLKGLTRLKQLGVCDSQVTDSGLEFLYSLPNFYVLLVENTKVTAEARSRFRKAFPMCTITPNP